MFGLVVIEVMTPNINKMNYFTHVELPPKNFSTDILLVLKIF